MNRNDEFWTLVQELENTPAALDGTAQRARTRAIRSKAAKFCGIPLGSLAGAAAAFILAVNMIPTFAAACADIPILSQLAAAVDFSPSLSAAVENKYVQTIDQTQSDGDRSLTLNYAIIDAHQITIFYSTDRHYEIFPDILRKDGEEEFGCSYSLYPSENDELNIMTFSFISGEKAPTDFILKLRIVPADDLSQPSTTFSFEISLDPELIAPAELLEVDQWVELEDGRIFVDYLEIYPTRTILYFGEDSENSAWIKSLKFWFEDGEGNRYDSRDGSLVASGAHQNTESMLVYYFQSLYFNDVKQLKLCISAAEWLSKDAQPVEVDLVNVSATNLPEYVTFAEVSKEYENELWAVFEAGPERTDFSQFFNWYGYTPEGEKYSDFTQGFRWVPDAEGNVTLIQEIIMLDNYPYDTITLVPRYTHMTLLDNPIIVTIK